MKNDLKNALKAGFIAAIVSALISTFIAWMGYLLKAFGFLGSPLGPFWFTISSAIIFIAFGTVLGLVYSWVYDYIPGKGIVKGICYGLGHWVLIDVFYGLYIAFIWPGDLAVGIGLIVTGIYYRFPYGLTFVAVYKK